MENYFKRSPFRSLPFNIATAALVLFAWVGARAAMSALAPRWVIVGLVSMPVVVWFISLLIHWEIRVAIGELADHRHKRFLSLHFDRLARLHYGLVLGVTLMSYIVMEGILRAFR
jgi:hypothetical protein